MRLSDVWIAFFFSLIVSLTVLILTSSFFGVKGVWVLFGLLLVVAFGYSVSDLKPKRRK